MKRKVVARSFIALMTLITCIGFFRDFATFLFAQGSNFMLQIYCVHIFYQVALVALFVIVYCLRKKLDKKNVYILLIITLLFWLLSGRTIGHLPFPDEKIITGWFYIQTSKTYVCNNTQNECENIKNETIVEEKPFWCVNIKNKDINEKIFVGPFIWSITTRYLEQVYDNPSDQKQVPTRPDL